jgi:hypothetical protein
MNIFVRAKEFIDIKNYNLKIVDDWESADIFWINKIKIPLKYFYNKIVSLYVNNEMITVKYNIHHTAKKIFKKINFMPKTFNYDESVVESLPQDKMIYIVKPGNSFASLCTEIMHAKDIKKFIENNNNKKCSKYDKWVIQEYIKDPFLIKSPAGNFLNKFDLRIVFFMHTDQKNKNMAVLVYNDILVKHAMFEYTLNKFDSKIHITNNPSIPEKLQKIRTTHFRDHKELQKFKPAIDAFIIDFIIPLLRTVYVPDINQNFISMSQLFGADLIIEKDGTIKLLEINENPNTENTFLRETQMNFILNLPNKVNLKQFVPIRNYPRFLTIAKNCFTGDRYKLLVTHPTIKNKNTFIIKDNFIYVDFYYGDDENHNAKYTINKFAKSGFVNSDRKKYIKMFLLYNKSCKNFNVIESYKLLKYCEMPNGENFFMTRDRKEYIAIKKNIANSEELRVLCDSIRESKYQIIFNFVEIHISPETYDIIDIINFDINACTLQSLFYVFNKAIVRYV